MSRLSMIPAFVLLAAWTRTTRTASAQDKPREEKTIAVPAHLLPAAGMCRVWLKDVPAAQQPAPTECAVAIRNRPLNAVVLFGKDLPARDTRGMAAPWAGRSNLGPAGRGPMATQAPPVTRLVAPEPTTTPQSTPTRVVAPAKPEKPR